MTRSHEVKDEDGCFPPFSMSLAPAATSPASSTFCRICARQGSTRQPPPYLCKSFHSTFPIPILLLLLIYLSFAFLTPPRLSPHLHPAPSPAFLQCHAQQIASTVNNTCMINEAGWIQCWGDSTHGAASPPTDAVGVAVCVGFAHACAIKEDGKVICWGCGSDSEPSVNHGQCNVPATNVNYSQVVCHGYRTCAIQRESHEIQCWGLAGKMPTDSSLQFQQISLGGGVEGEILCGILMNGTAKCYPEMDGAVGGLEPSSNITFTSISVGRYDHSAFPTWPTGA